MKTRLDFLSEQFLLGDNGEIICDAVVRLQVEELPIDKKTFFNFVHEHFPDVNGKGVFSVSAKAICGNEEFDYEKGSRIAETRMQAKAYNKASRIYKKLLEELTKIDDELNIYRINCIKCEIHSKEHLKTLDETL